MTLVRELVGSFNADMQLKAKLAYSYDRDSFDLLRRINATNYFIDKQIHTPNRSLIAKKFVDIVMAIECALKSLMISLAVNNIKPEDIYKTVRKKSHKIYDLALDVKNHARKRVKFLSVSELDLLNKAQGLGIRTRYEVDVFFLITQEDYMQRITQTGMISSTINDPQWIEQLDGTFRVRSCFLTFDIVRKYSTIPCVVVNRL